MITARSKPVMGMVRTGAILFALSVSPSTALADLSWWDLKLGIAAVKLRTWFGRDTPAEENRDINAFRHAYDLKHGSATVGHAMIGGEALSDLPDGTSTTLTFAFVIAKTREPVEVPEVVSVRYEIQANPPTEDPVFEFLGTSENRASGFALPYVISGFEPLIIAVPLDASGEPVEMRTPGGSDVSGGVAINIFVEEPIPTVSEWRLIVLILLLLTAGTVVLGRRRRLTPA